MVLRQYLKENPAECRCGSTDCSTESYCDKSTSTCRTVPYCNKEDGLTANSAACASVDQLNVLLIPASIVMVGLAWTRPVMV